jgi:hypothetical protein
MEKTAYSYGQPTVGGPPGLGLAEGQTNPRHKKIKAYGMLHAGQFFFCKT